MTSFLLFLNEEIRSAIIDSAKGVNQSYGGRLSKNH